MIGFGPVPSRRLGRSLGINNIPAKICTYACVYCQLGRTVVKSIERKSYYGPEKLVSEVSKKLELAEKDGIRVDYLTFVPDGEPTLDINLEKEVDELRSLGVKLAVISNSSLLWMEDVRSALMNFDFISLKLDAVTESLWKRIDRPHESLKLEEILHGMLEFSRKYGGTLVTETMLIDGVDYYGEAKEIGSFLKELSPDKAYLSIPTRPPAEEWAKAPPEDVINMVFQEYRKSLGNRVEYLIGYEGNEFSSTGNPEEDILAITSVHPMREDAVKEFLKKSGEDWGLIERLIEEGRLVSLEYGGHRYYMRKIASRY